MLNVLILTTDMPFFPGRNGHDFFNLRFLSKTHRLGMVAPLHDGFPAAGVANLEKFLGHACFWPRPAAAVSLPPRREVSGGLALFLRSLPGSWRSWLLLKLLRQTGQPLPALAFQLGTLSNCAPHLLAALAAQSWQVVVLIQSSSISWFDFLPSHLAKVVYFHDVRTDYLPRGNGTRPAKPFSNRDFTGVFREESRACAEAEAVGFVSDLDKERAQKLFDGSAERCVAPIPIDTDYFVPAPAGWQRPAEPIVLFTGHLGHPPNVDAVQYFLREVWPLVLAGRPDAIFEVAGAFPRDDLRRSCDSIKGVRLVGNVPDIRPHFWNARVYVIPMRYGGGVRQKIFEAWSMGIPVVATRMAVEGTRAQDSINCQLRDDPSEFASEVLRLLEVDAPRLVVESGRQTAETFNSIGAAAPQFQKIVERAPAIKRTRPFRLLFDLRWMTIGRAGGLEQLAHELISSIAQLDRRNEYRFHCPRSTYWEWAFPPSFRQKPIFCDENESRAEALHSGLVNGLAKSLGVPPLMTSPMRALRAYHKMDFDLVHSVCSYIHPDLAAFPNVLTMCDLQHRHHPEFFTTAALDERERLYRISCESARHILCISEFTRQDIHRTYGTPLERMSTVWVIPSRTVHRLVALGERRDILLRFGLQPGRYFYFPAHPWPHKNHVRLIEAFKLAMEDLPRDVSLVLTGKSFPVDHPVLATIARLGLAERVRHLGYRSPLEVAALYSGAMALVFPSLFEGFGMPVAEAMIAGIPVACSNSTSLPEIAGPAALLFNPLDAGEIAQSLVRLAHDGRLRSELVELGNARKLLFSARRSAIQTMAVYHRVFQEYYGPH